MVNFCHSQPIARQLTYHELLTLLETPQERCQSTNIHGVREDGHQVVKDTSDLSKECSDELGSLGNLDVEQLLDGEGEALLVGHHRDVVESVKVRQGLEICLVLDQLLGTSMQQTDVGVGADNLLAVELENQTQHAVSGGMLRTKVDGVVSDLAVRNRVLARLSGATGKLAGQAVGIARIGKVLVDGDKSGTDGLGSGVLSQ